MLRNFLLQVALAEEFAWFLSGTRTTKLTSSPSAVVFELNMDPPPLIVVSGVGKIAAASAVAGVISSRPDIDAVLSFGVSGSLVQDLSVGDLVVANGVIEHDFEVPVLSEKEGDRGARRYRHTRADPVLSEILSGHCRDVVALGGDSLMRTQVGSTRKVVRGDLCSGDQLVTSPHRRDALAQAHPTSCAVDMETAAVAYVAGLHALPWGSVRMISDEASEELDPTSFLDFVASSASRVLGEIFARLVGLHGDVMPERTVDDSSERL